MKHLLLSLGIIAVVCVFGGLLLLRLPINNPAISASSPIVSTSAVPVNQRVERDESSASPQGYPVDPDAFYQTIIDNNIFRPLNWEPPQRVSAYTLLGTAIATDGSSAVAYIQERESDQFYAVSVGQQVGKMTVGTIAPKRVTLTQNGVSLMLCLRRVPFLNPHSTRGTPTREPPPLAVTMKKETPRTVTAEEIPDAAREWRKTLEERAAKIRAERERMRAFLQQYEKQ